MNKELMLFEQIVLQVAWGILVCGEFDAGAHRCRRRSFFVYNPAPSSARSSTGIRSWRRNFEAGILTDDPELVQAAMNHFDSVWAGFRCKDCGRRKFCGDSIV